eukprot:m.271448 g.271448  ORF g.271448 m.271448 type:complete len:260 (+) comp54778_c0_seq2:1372-2151(+)
MAVVVELCNRREGTERTLRLAQYACKLLSNTEPPPAHRHVLIRLLHRVTTSRHNLKPVASAISSTRAFTRFFDSPLMVLYALQYGLGHSETNTFRRIINVIKNFFDTFYYFAEHIAIMIDFKIFNPASWNAVFFFSAKESRGDSTLYWYFGDICWVASLIGDLLLNTQELLEIVSRRSKQRQSREKVDSETKQAAAQRVRKLWILLLRDSADLVNAINWCPPGVLWAGALSDRAVGFFGTISSIIKFGYMIQGLQASRE